MKSTLRSRLLTMTAVAALLTATGCASTSDATGAESGAAGENGISLAISTSMSNLPLFVADSEEIWEEHDVTPRYVDIPSAPDAAAAFTSGDLDLANLLPNAIIPLVDQGAELDVIGKNPNGSILDILVRSDFDLPQSGDWTDTMKALEGSRVGVVAKGSGVEDYTRALFAEAGVDPDAQTYIATGLPGPTLAALSKGHIDMSLTFEPGLTNAVESDIATRPFSIMAGEGPELLQAPGGLMVAPDEFVAENGDLLNRYFDVYNEAIAWIKNPANREAVLEIVENKVGVDPDLAPLMLENNIGGYPDDARLSAEDIAQLDAISSWVSDIGRTESQLDADEWLVEFD